MQSYYRLRLISMKGCHLLISYNFLNTCRILYQPHHKDIEPTGLQIYSTVSQSPSAGIVSYTFNILLHSTWLSNHCTSCSRQVEPKQTVSKMCHITSISMSLWWSWRESHPRPVCLPCLSSTTNSYTWSPGFSKLKLLYIIQVSCPEGEVIAATDSVLFLFM